MRIYEDLVGKNFGRLVVVSFAGSKNKKRRWNCICECGGATVADTSSLNSGNTTSCICLRIEKSKKATITHGMSNGCPEYIAWKHMKSRCYNPNDEKYPNYGARGIIVCPRWLGKQGFINFLSDMGKKPTLDHSIDRHPNNNGNYEPTNCRWATDLQQAGNTTRSRWIVYKDKRMILQDWVRFFNMHRSTLERRLKNYSEHDTIEYFLKKKGVVI